MMVAFRFEVDHIAQGKFTYGHNGRRADGGKE